MRKGRSPPGTGREELRLLLPIKNLTDCFAASKVFGMERDGKGWYN